MNNFIIKGSRILVFDPLLYIDDIKTPLSEILKPATVISRYGFISEYIEKEHGREAAKYDDCVDVRFDHRPNIISKGHFTKGVTLIDV